MSTTSSESSEENTNTTNKMDPIFIEQVVKYVKIDDTIKKKQKEHREEIKNIKEMKDVLEKSLLEHLERAESDFINIGNKGKLVKTVSETKAPIKREHITTSIREGLYENKLVTDEDTSNMIIEAMLNLIEKKRPIKRKEFLKRTNSKK